jgi:hypothetical protein
MELVFQAALSNALVATVMAVLVFFAANLWRHPALFHWLWILVLVRLVMPPLINVSIRFPAAEQPKTSSLTSPRKRFWQAARLGKRKPSPHRRTSPARKLIDQVGRWSHLTTSWMLR